MTELDVWALAQLVLRQLLEIETQQLEVDVRQRNIALLNYLLEHLPQRRKIVEHRDSEDGILQDQVLVFGDEMVASLLKKSDPEAREAVLELLNVFRNRSEEE